MSTGNNAPTRRAVLTAAAATAALATTGLSGCGLVGSANEAPPLFQPGPDPVEPLLAGTLALVDRYEKTIAAVPALADRLTPLRDAHRAHVAALARELGLNEASPAPSGRPLRTVFPTPSPTGSTGPSGAASPGRPNPSTTPGTPGTSVSPPPIPTAGTDPATVLAGLAGLERAAQRDAETLCLTGPSYRAALLGTIAACRASHVEVLR